MGANILPLANFLLWNRPIFKENAWYLHFKIVINPIFVLLYKKRPHIIFHPEINLYELYLVSRITFTTFYWVWRGAQTCSKYKSYKFILVLKIIVAFYFITKTHSWMKVFFNSVLYAQQSYKVINIECKYLGKKGIR